MLQPDVLLVEDDPVDAKFFTRAANKINADLRIEWVKDGQAAVDYIERMAESRKPLPKLVVLDIKLPKLRGFDVLARIRNNTYTKRVPAVMMSGSTQLEDIELAYDLGANGYLSKPSTFGQLNEIVGKLVGYWITANTSVSTPNNP